MRAKRRCRFFEHRYRWTGAGIERDPEVLSEGTEGGALHRLHGPVVRNGESRIFLIDLGRDLSAGEVEEVHFTQSLIDRQAEFLPRLRKLVQHPIDELELRVVLPPELQGNVRAITQEVGSDRELEVLPVEHVDGGYFQLRIEHPQQGLRYGIHWDR